VLMKKASDIRSAEITDERLYLNRRDFMKAASGAALGAVVAAAAVPPAIVSAQTPLANVQPSPLSTAEPPNPFEHIIGYNNFYEFGSEKDDPEKYAARLKTTPWKVKVEGQITTRETNYNLEDILKPHALEERVYRLRCVEGWSMVIPWIGFPLGDLIKRVAPNSKARFVQFQTLYRPGEMPGQSEPLVDFPGIPSDRHHLLGDGERNGELEWPYLEGLRMDEAMHPLTILAVGLYGRTLLNQNGAPLRLIVPWKYGFKSIKSIVKIRFVENRPNTTWNLASAVDFGFYANVNPDVPRPQSQKTERRLGKFFRQPTQMFNGYAAQVGEMYSKMDLKTDY
jgi:methionine sulfoxide reductase catalytic subunit